MDNLCSIGNDLDFQSIKDNINLVLWNHFENLWSVKINRESAIRGQGRNKLRTYRTFKQSFKAEQYVKSVISRKARQSLAKFRCGTAPLRIETGRYVGEREHDRLCVLCDAMEVENEEHCLIRCNRYADIRNTLFAAAINIDNTFLDKTDNEKMSFVLANENLVFETAKACQHILHTRSMFLQH